MRVCWCIRTVFDRYRVCFLFNFSFCVACRCFPVLLSHQRYICLFLVHDIFSLRTRERNGHLVTSFWTKIQCEQPSHGRRSIVLMRFFISCFMENAKKIRVLLFIFFFQENKTKMPSNQMIEIWNRKVKFNLADLAVTTKQFIIFFSPFYCWFFFSSFLIVLPLAFLLLRLMFVSITSYCALSPVSFHLSIVIFYFFFFCYSASAIVVFRGVCHFQRENGCFSTYSHILSFRFRLWKCVCFFLFAFSLVFWFNVINFKQRLNAKLMHLHPKNSLTITKE